MKVLCDWCSLKYAHVTFSNCLMIRPLNLEPTFAFKMHPVFPLASMNSKSLFAYVFSPAFLFVNFLSYFRFSVIQSYSNKFFTNTTCFFLGNDLGLLGDILTLTNSWCVSDFLLNNCKTCFFCLMAFLLCYLNCCFLVAVLAG